MDLAVLALPGLDGGAVEGALGLGLLLLGLAVLPLVVLRDLLLRDLLVRDLLVVGVVAQVDVAERQRENEGDERPREAGADQGGDAGGRPARVRLF